MRKNLLESLLELTMGSSSLEFHFGHINLAHSDSATLQFSKDISSGNFHIFSVNEPYFYNDFMPYVPSEYMCIKNTGYPRACIVVRNDIKFDVIKCTDLVLCLKLYIDFNVELYFYSVYCSPNDDLSVVMPTLYNLLSNYAHCSNLVLGDFNAKASLWGSPTTDHRGKEVIEFVNVYDLEILNDPESVPTYSSSRGISWIDIALVKNPLNYKISVEVLDRISASDHNMMVGKIDGINVVLHKRDRISVGKLKSFKVKSKLKKLLKQYDTDITELEDFNSEIVELQDHILNNLKSNVQNNSYNCKFDKSKFWWNAGLEKMRSRVRAQRRRFQRERTDLDLRERYRAEFRKGLAYYKRSIANAKRESFKRYISSIVVKDSFGVNYRYISDKISKACILGPIQINGVEVREQNIVRDYILNYHFPVINSVENWNVENGDLGIFKLHEIELAISAMKNGKAPGPDGITVEVCKVLLNLYPEWFINCYNKCLTLGYFPRCWKIAKVVLIPKPNKDVGLCSSYRPICLLSVFGKVLDKIICNRLTYYLESRELLNDRQYGFRKGRSSVNAVGNIVRKVHNEKSKGNGTCLISLDLSNAFNSVRWNDIRRLLIKYKVPVGLRNLINSFISNRHYVRSTGELGEYNVGVPQGSSLGPILWLLVINEFLNDDFGDNINVQAYADDIAILIHSKVNYKYELMSKVALDKVLAWCNMFHLKVNVEKCGFIILGKKVTRIPPVKYNNEKIRYNKELKYLGITFDENLSWLRHLENLRDKVFGLNSKLVRLSRATWGLNAHILKEIYKCAVEKMVMYGNEIWFKDNVRVVTKLRQIQRISLLGITKCYATVSGAGLCVLSGVIPLDIRIREQKKLYDLRYLNSDIYIDLDRFGCDDVDWGSNIVDPSRDRRIAWNLYDESCMLDSDYCIFTDGSKLNDNVGFGFIVYKKGVEVYDYSNRINDYCSVFDAEACAVLKVLNYINNSKLTGYINVCTDSRSVLMSLNSLKTGSYLIDCIRDEYESCVAEVKFVWVKAHIGVLGNERADSLAKDATARNTVDYYVKISKYGINKALYKKMLDNWQLEWNNNVAGRSTYNILPFVSDKRVYGDFFTNQFITRHGIFPKYQKDFHRKNVRCLCGSTEGSVEHVVYLCNYFLDIRREYFPTDYNNMNLKQLIRINKVRKGLVKIVNIFLQAYLPVL